MLSPSTKKGAHFEKLVEDTLNALHVEFPLRVKVVKHPNIILQNGEIVVPDFELSADFPHVFSSYLIECQDRKKNSKAILHKILHIRAKSNRNKFIFLYMTSISQETKRALDSEGIMVLSWDRFNHFINQIKIVLVATPPPDNSGGGGDWDEVGEQEEEE